jgi:hypothetical protein
MRSRPFLMVSTILLGRRRSWLRVRVLVVTASTGRSWHCLEVGRERKGIGVRLDLGFVELVRRGDIVVEDDVLGLDFLGQLAVFLPGVQEGVPGVQGIPAALAAVARLPVAAEDVRQLPH